MEDGESGGAACTHSPVSFVSNPISSGMVPPRFWLLKSLPVGSTAMREKDVKRGIWKGREREREREREENGGRKKGGEDSKRPESSACAAHVDRCHAREEHTC